MMQAPRRLAARLAVPLILAAACSGQVPAGTATGQSADVVYGSRVHKFPMNAAASSPTPFATASDLTYRGGAVISNVQTVQVLWGSGTYISQVTGGAPNMGTSYTAMSNSNYIDWL